MRRMGGHDAPTSLEIIGTTTYLGNDYNLIYEIDQHLIMLDFPRGADL